MKIKIVRALSALITASLLIFGSVAFATPASAAPRDDVVTSVNQQRAAAGLSALAQDPTLDAAAQAWANEMSRANSMTHSTNEWRAARIPAGWFTNGENIAYGYGSAGAVMQAWMGSAGHKENILRSSYTHIGVGYVASGNYWVQIFAGYDSGAAPKRSPIGSFDEATVQVGANPATISVRGWAVDQMKASTASVVHLYVTDPAGDTNVTALSASGNRPDVATVFPPAGPSHGFAQSFVPAKQGWYKLCAYAIGTPAGNNTLLGCKSVLFGPAAPAGAFDEAAVVVDGGSAAVRVRGWGLDRAYHFASTKVRVSVTGPSGAEASRLLDASEAREDIAAVFPGAGAAHGFSAVVPIPSTGVSKVCVYARGLAAFGGGETALGCRNVGLPVSTPAGVFDELRVDASANGIALTARGWALDRAFHFVSTSVRTVTTNPDGSTSTMNASADGDRPDIGAAFPGAGSAHGFSAAVKMTGPGTYRSCVYAVSASVFAPKETSLGCQTFQVGPGAPDGALDTTFADRAAGGIVVSGWLMDQEARPLMTDGFLKVTNPDKTVRTIPVTVGDPRSDVAAVFPGAGGAQGFRLAFPAPVPGQYQVCLNSNPIRALGGSAVPIKCSLVTVTAS